jgi:TonB family protein
MGKPRIEVDRPCVLPGVTFEPRDGGRFCLSCQEMQHDLTEATHAEALALMQANGGRICGKFRAGPSGELRFKPEPPSRAGRATRGAALALALTGCSSPSDTPPPETVTTTSAPPPPTSIAIAPPPSTAASPDAISSATHTTDASSDAADHEGHWHTHAPVGISGHHIHGGATAFQPPIEGPSGAVRFEPLRIQSEGTGTMDKAVLVSLLRARQGQVRALYLSELRSRPDTEGEVVCAITIGPSGAVTDGSIVSNDTGDLALAGRLLVMLRSLRVSPAPEGGSVTCQIPWHFERQEPVL